MTCCVAALADNRKAIILVSDRKIGSLSIESEPDIEKVIRLHRDWWLMLSGDDISPVFDIADMTIRLLKTRRSVSYETIKAAIVQAYQEKENAEAESLYLRPLGLSLESFNQNGIKYFSDVERRELRRKLSEHELSIELLIAGFEGQRGVIFTMPGGEQHTRVTRQDNPGFAAIGSGGEGAEYMMMYRDVGYKMPTRLALYYAMEGKYFGELATGVGEDTDVHILQPGGEDTQLDSDTGHEVFFNEHKLCWQLAPNIFGAKHAKVINSLPRLRKFKKLTPKDYD